MSPAEALRVSKATYLLKNFTIKDCFCQPQKGGNMQQPKLKVEMLDVSFN